MLPIREHFRMDTRHIDYPVYDEGPIQYTIAPDGDFLTQKPSHRVPCDNSMLVKVLEEAEKLINDELVIDERTYDRISFRSMDNHNEKRDLFKLYTLYLCYCKIVWDEEPDNKICKSYIRSTYGYDLDSFLDCCWAQVACMIKDNEIPQYYLDVDLKNHKLFETICCEDQKNALRALLLEHIRMGDYGKDGGGIAKCIRCGRDFVKEHGNAKLCKTCRKNSEKCKAYKIRKKERISNAAQSNS